MKRLWIQTDIIQNKYKLKIDYLKIMKKLSLNQALKNFKLFNNLIKKVEKCQRNLKRKCTIYQNKKLKNNFNK